MGCSAEARRETGEGQPSHWSAGLLPCAFQLYPVESLVSPRIFEEYLRYSSQEQNELYSHGLSHERSTHKSHWLGGNLTWKGKYRRQISPCGALICETAGVGATCIGCKAAEPLGGAVSYFTVRFLNSSSTKLNTSSPQHTLNAHQTSLEIVLLHTRAVGALPAAVWVRQQRPQRVESENYYPHRSAGDAATAQSSLQSE